MKKVLATLWVLALIAGAASCKKDNPKPEPASETPAPGEDIVYPVYHEGQYVPLMQVSTVTENGELSEEWTWDGDRLDYITYSGAQSGTARFHYDGDYISSVKGGAGQQDLYYTYSNGKITHMELVDGDTPLVQADLTHGGSGDKITGATLDVDDEYLQSLIGAMTGLLGKTDKAAPKSLKALLRMAAKDADPKFEITDNTITLGYTWNGENVATQVLNVSVDGKLSQEEYETLSQYLPIPEQYRTIADMLVAAQGGLPLRITMNDTTTYTYDNRINPMFCFWGTMLSADILSLNNILTATTTGSYTIAAVIMGQQVNLLNNPTDDYEEFSYEYNSKYYPTKKIGGEEVSEYTYR